MPLQPKPLPPLSVLREMFECDFCTGALYAKKSRSTLKAGERADRINVRGYRWVFLGRYYYAHRIVWALAHGEEPPMWLDHINGDHADNRLSNLRLASHSENMRNRSAASHSASGIKGLHRRKDNGMWRAYFVVGGERTNLGQFASQAEAERALQTARREAHRQFARD